MDRLISRRDLIKIAALGGISSLLPGGGTFAVQKGQDAMDAELLLVNGRITTLGSAQPQTAGIAVKNVRFIAVGTDAAWRKCH